jgi:vancomycin resistance protein YoaR
MATTQPTSQAVSRSRAAKPKKNFSLGRFLLGALALVVWITALAAVGGVVTYEYQHTGRVFQGVQVRGIDLSNLTVSEAEERLRVAFDPYPLAPVTVRYGDQSWVLTAADLGVDFDARSAAEAAYRVGRQPIVAGDVPAQLTQLQANLQQQLAAYRQGHEVLATEAIDRSAGLAWLEAKAKEINRPVAEATLRIDGQNVSSTSSQVGYSLDVLGTHEALYQALLANQGETIELQVKEVKPLLADVTQAEVFVRQVLDGPITLTATDPDLDTPAPPPSYTVSVKELAPLVSTELAPQIDGSLQVVTHFDVSPLRAKVQGWAADLAREPRDAKLDYTPQSNAITVVSPSQIGRTLDVDATLEAIRQAALSSKRAAALPLTLVEPPVNMHKIDQMGVKELVAQGTTSFKGSSPDRVHNIATASKAVDNAVVPPGATFSFNQAVGDVSAETGYKDSLIIWGDRTAVGIGGGLCQVSTTVFRAAYYGGFPLEERWNHGYVVGWYGQPGLDATVYTPTVDFKFRNTTDHYLIIKSEMDEAKGTLTFKFYGTKPDWQVEVTGPVIEKETPAPAPIYQEDASLAAGETKQVEFAKNGVDVEWRRVVKDGQGQVVSDEVLKSSYTPWPAYFLVGPGTPPPGAPAETPVPEATAAPPNA